MRTEDFATKAFPFEKSVECECGGHSLITRVAEGDGIAEIAGMLPKGSVAAVIAESEDFTRDFMRALRRQGVATRFILSETDERKLRIEDVGDEVRLFIAYGGEREADCAKRYGKLRGLPVFVCVCSPDAVTVLDGYCELWDGDVLVLKEGAVPVGAALARDKLYGSHNLPSAFGGICAVAAGLFDREAYARATGKTHCAVVREAAFDLLYAALDVAARKERAGADLPFALAEIALKLSLLAQAGGGCWVRGAADECARAASSLFRREERRRLTRGEFAYVFGAVLSNVYREFARMPRAFTPPPDNNLRAERISEYFGIDELASAKLAVGRMKNVGLAAYRVHEYGEELCEIAEESARVFADAKRRFKRMYPDDGYGLTSVIDASDVKTVIALAPDLYPVRGSALTLMREFGLLERYL